MIKSDLQLDLMRVLVKHGLLPIRALRDEIIRKEYFSRLNAHPEIKKGVLREELAQKYNTSEKNIEVILYQSQKREGLYSEHLDLDNDFIQNLLAIG